MKETSQTAYEAKNSQFSIFAATEITRHKFSFTGSTNEVTVRKRIRINFRAVLKMTDEGGKKVAKNAN
jgi:hypothetical protein